MTSNVIRLHAIDLPTTTENQMAAKPLIPGLLYAVKDGKQLRYVAASNGLDAIAKALSLPFTRLGA